MLIVLLAMLLSSNSGAKSASEMHNAVAVSKVVMPLALVAQEQILNIRNGYRVNGCICIAIDAKQLEAAIFVKALTRYIHLTFSSFGTTTRTTGHVLLFLFCTLSHPNPMDTDPSSSGYSFQKGERRKCSTQCHRTRN
jgi:hypothetical protein